MAKRWQLLLLGFMVLSSPLFLRAPVAAFEWTPVTDERLLNAAKDPNNWLQYYRTLDGWRYSPLSQINARNVKKLQVKWMFSLAELGEQEGHPIVNDGVLIVTASNIPHNSVYALDAATGRQLWKWTRKTPEDLTAFARNHPHSRGVAVYENLVIVPTLDAKLFALDARTGNEVWQTTLADYKDGYYLNSPPIVVKGMIIMGPGGPGEMGVRGFAAALDAKTSKEIWKTWIVPEPGQPGGDTWEGDSWQRGGGPIWLPPTYDAETDTVYVGTGNPAPFIDAVRRGDNLYTSSVVALDRATGKIKWYYQYVPNDAWDFDTMNEHTVLTLKRDGKEIPAIVAAHKIGFLYGFDRRDGKPLYAKKFAKRVDWAEGIDMKTGRPIERPGTRPVMGGDKIEMCPSLLGARNWVPSTYSPMTGLLYLPTVEICMKYGYVKEIKYTRGLAYVGVSWDAVVKDENTGAIRAYNPNTGDMVWEYPSREPMIHSGLLSSGGGLLFFQTLDGKFKALDAKTGKLLYEFNSGLLASAAPVSYAVNGKQYVAVVAGGKTRIRGWFSAERKLDYLVNQNFNGMLVVYGLPD
jgi:PQQ-dependent dehydrogenase (methanol/ethanol family)